jgi:hypothetical protein
MDDQVFDVSQYSLTVNVESLQEGWHIVWSAFGQRLVAFRIVVTWARFPIPQTPAQGSLDSIATVCRTPTKASFQNYYMIHTNTYVTGQLSDNLSVKWSQNSIPTPGPGLAPVVPLAACVPPLGHGEGCDTRILNAPRVKG